MKKVITVVAFLLVVLAVNAFAGWQFSGYFPTDTTKATGISPNYTGAGASSFSGHGLAVDPDGKVWVQNYYAFTRDSVLVPVSTRVSKHEYVRCIYVYNRDGSPASFSPIKFITVDGVQDTVGGFTNLATGAWNVKAGAGLRSDHQGNILASCKGWIYRIDYKTGQGMAKFTHDPVNTTVAVGVASENGKIFSAGVLPGIAPIKEWDADLNYLGNVTELSTGYCRTLAASPDGNTVYWTAYSNNAVWVYSRPSEFDAFVGPDTVLKGFACESVTWHPKNGLLYFASGSYLTPANKFPGAVTDYKTNSWYGVDVSDWSIKDQFEWKMSANAKTAADSANERPRALAFSVSGDTAYVTVFDRGGVEMFVKMPDGPMTANVTFQADVTDMLTKGFNPGTDKLYVLGGFNGWAYNDEWATQADLVVPTLYSVTHAITDVPGTVYGWKFRGSPEGNFADGGWEGGDNHTFTFTGMDLELAAFKPAVVPAGKKLAQDVTVLFTVRVGGAKDYYNKKDFPTVDGVYLNGDFATTGGWAGWTVGDTTGGQLVKMYDDGTMGDAVAKDGIWSANVLFTAGTAAAHYYKYGIYSKGYTDTLNAGTIPMDNEAGFAMNHELSISDAAPVFVAPTDKFGSQWTKVERLPTEALPEHFALHANYPNPFNPTTFISYDLAAKSRVRLTVFNAMGQIVANLVDSEQNPGSYRVSWNGTNLDGAIAPSGVYFYRLEGNGFAKTMKMTLMK